MVSDFANHEKIDFEERMGQVVSQNIDFINKNIGESTAGESWGGNASGVEINGEYFTGVGVNLLYDKSGKLLKFDNVDKNGIFLCGAVIDFDKLTESSPLFILNFSPDDDKENEEIRDIMKITRFTYNIQRARNFKDLSRVLAIEIRGAGGIKFKDSSGRELDLESLLSVIKGVISGKLDLSYITRKYGLRDKVAGLMSRIKADENS